MVEERRPYTIIPFGASRTGKSNLLNKIIGKEGEFKYSKELHAGET